VTYPKLPRHATRESDVLKQCLDLLKLRRVFHFRNQTGALAVGQEVNRRFVRFGAVGSSDIIAILPTHSRRPGVFLALEIKRPGGRVSKPQARFLANVKHHGAEAHVIEDVVQLDELLTDLGC
jgi:hypothetical protein